MLIPTSVPADWLEETNLWTDRQTELGLGRYSETRFDTFHDTLGTILYISQYILYPKCFQTFDFKYAGSGSISVILLNSVANAIMKYENMI